LRAKAFSLLIGCIWPVVCFFVVVSTLFVGLGQLGGESMLLDLFRPEITPAAEGEPARSLEALPSEWLATLGSLETGFREAEASTMPDREPALPPRERPRKAAHEFEPQMILAQPAPPMEVVEPKPLNIEFTPAPVLDEVPPQATAVEVERPPIELAETSAIEMVETGTVRVSAEPPAPEAVPEAPAESTEREEHVTGERRTEDQKPQSGRPPAEHPAPPPVLADSAPQPATESRDSSVFAVNLDRPEAPRPPKREEERRALPSRAPLERAKPAEEPARQNAPVMGLRIWQRPEVNEKPHTPSSRLHEPSRPVPAVEAEVDRESRHIGPLVPREVMPNRVFEPKAAAVEPVEETQTETLPKAAPQGDDVAPPAEVGKADAPEVAPVEPGAGPALAQSRVEDVVQAPPAIKPVKVDIPPAVKAERSAAAPVVEERKPALVPQPVIRVKLDVPEAEPVHVQFVQRAGEVHVLVRSDEPGASTRLASRIDELAHDLHSNGVEAESWAGNDELPEAQREEAASRTLALADQHSAETREQSTGDRRSQRQLPEWLEMLAEREDEAALRRFRRLNEKEESQWRQ
jgi:hypothetical protein